MATAPAPEIESALALTTTLDSITGVLGKQFGTTKLTFSITPTHFQIDTRSYGWDTIDVVRFVGPTLYVRASGRVQGYGPIAEYIQTDARDWLEGVVHTYLQRSSSQTIPDALQQLRAADHTPAEE